MANGLFNFGDRSIYDNTGAYDTMQPNQTMQPPQAGLLSPKGGQGAVTGIGERGKGILGSLFGAIGNAVRSPDFGDRLVLATGGLQMFPNEQAMAMARENIGRRRAEEQQMMQANSIAEQFKSMGRPEIAQFVRSNPQYAPEFLAQYMQQQYFPEPTEQWTTFIGEDGRLYRQEQSTGKVEAVGGGGATLSPTFNVGGEEGSLGASFLEAIQNPIAATIEALPAQQEFLKDLEVLEDLIQGADLSTAQRLLGQYAPNLASLGDETGRVGAANAIIARLAPTIRETGSGSTSDREMAMYIRGLPSFLNDNANILTVELFRAKVRISEEINEVATQIALKEISESEGLRRIRELRAQSIMTPETRDRITRLIPDFQWDLYNTAPNTMELNQQTVPSGYTGG